MSDEYTALRVSLTTQTAKLGCYRQLTNVLLRQLTSAQLCTLMNADEWAASRIKNHAVNELRHSSDGPPWHDDD